MGLHSNIIYNRCFVVLRRLTDFACKRHRHRMHYKYGIMAVGYEWQATYETYCNVMCGASSPEQSEMGVVIVALKTIIKYYTKRQWRSFTVMQNMIIGGVWVVMLTILCKQRWELFIIVLLLYNKHWVWTAAWCGYEKWQRRKIDYRIFSRVWSISYASVLDGKGTYDF